MDLAGLRRDYRAQGLLVDDLPTDPLQAFVAWFDEIREAAGPDANAVVLATADPVTLRPSARTVLLKGIEAGRLLFYTNYRSRKAAELDANPQATLCFSWVFVGRQLRVEGAVERSSAAASDAYFEGRPRGSQIGAWASAQSQPVADRAALEAAAAEVEQRFAGGQVPRPPHWGGYALDPDRFEFWQGREDRLHDRIEYRRRRGDRWDRRRLAP